MMSYPVYVLLNLDNVRTLSVEDLSDELKAELEERRKLRAEGKLNVLVQKTWLLGSKSMKDRPEKGKWSITSDPTNL